MKFILEGKLANKYSPVKEISIIILSNKIPQLNCK